MKVCVLTMLILKIIDINPSNSKPRAHESWVVRVHCVYHTVKRSVWLIQCFFLLQSRRITSRRILRTR